MPTATKRALASAVLTTVVVIGLGGCSGTAQPRRSADSAHSARRVRRAGSGDRKPTPEADISTLGARAPGSLRHGALPAPGVTLRVDSHGARLAVTLRRVIDPLKGSGAELPGRTRAIGVIIQIRSAGPRLYDSSATGDVSIVASAGPVTPVLATRGVCRTPVEDFDRYITAGEDRIGCVVFAVADAATLDAVRFSPHAHRLGRLIWAA